MKKFSLLSIVLLAVLVVSACANQRLPAPTTPESPASVTAPASPTAAPTSTVASPTPAQTLAATTQPATTDAPTPTQLATEEFDVRSGKLLTEASIRAEANGTAEVLGQKPAGSIVVVTGDRGDWYEIVSGLANDGHAWIDKSAVTFELVSPTPTATAAAATPEPVAAPTAASQPAPAAAAPAESALAGLLVFQDAPGGTIYLMNADGSGLRRLTTGLEPALSPDGSQVAFTRWDEPRGLWLINSDGSNERLVFGANRVRSPSWTPDGQAVIFEHNTGSQDCRLTPFGCLSEELVQQVFGGQPCLTTPLGEICIRDYALVTIWYTGLARYNLADGTDHDLPAPDRATAPQINPAGNRIIYLDPSGYSETPADRDGSPWPIVQETVPLGPASYSPDDQYLYGSRKQHDHWQIWRWQVQGGQGAPLTVPDPLGTTTSNNVAPSVSPDGKSVAFLTDRTGKWELWVMNADGSNQRPLASDALAGVNFRYDFNSDRTVDWGL